jgi:hypothetical protein
VGRGDAITARLGLWAGGTEVPSNAKSYNERSYNESAVPELPRPVNRVGMVGTPGDIGATDQLANGPVRSQSAVVSTKAFTAQLFQRSDVRRSNTPNAI